MDLAGRCAAPLYVSLRCYFNNKAWGPQAKMDLTKSLASAQSGAFIMQVVDIGLSEIDAFSVQYARAFKPREFRLMFDHSSNWRLAV